MQRGVSRAKKVLALMLVYVLLLAAGCVSSQSSAEADAALAAQGILTVKGKVKEVSLEDGIITVRPKKGGKVTVGFNAETVFKGVASAGEIEKDQPVKILYKEEGGKKMAVSVEKLLGGC